MTEKKLAGNEMFELVKEEYQRILGKVEVEVKKRQKEFCIMVFMIGLLRSKDWILNYYSIQTLILFLIQSRKENSKMVLEMVKEYRP